VSGKGGGKAAVDLNQHEASTVIAALCALGPGGAADAVTTFKTIRRVGANEIPENVWVPSLTDTLWMDLAVWIVTLAYEIQTHPDRKLAEHGWISTWELVACLDSSLAWISYTDVEGKKIVLEYSDPQSEMLEPDRHTPLRHMVPGSRLPRVTTARPVQRRGIRQMAHVDATALEVFAQVFLDFVKATGNPPKSETAAFPARKAAGSPDQPNDEPNRMGSQQSHRKRGEKKPQPRAESRSGPKRRDSDLSGAAFKVG
jgi:hypothetical protein